MEEKWRDELDFAMFFQLLKNDVNLGVDAKQLLIKDKPDPERQHKLRRMKPKGPVRQAINLVWHPTNGNDLFWDEFRLQVFPLIKKAKAAGTVSMFLPMEHANVALPKASHLIWSVSTVIIGEPGKDLEGLMHQLKNFIGLNPIMETGNLRAIDFMQIQDGIDLFYPSSEGLKREARMMQWIEYVRSHEEHRDTYYKQQYEFSGPAMRELHERDMCGRFVGFELVERVFQVRDFPTWDVLHIPAFTPWQILKSLPFYNATWKRQAKKVFGRDADYRKIMKDEWDLYRDKAMARAKQIKDLTIQKVD